MPGVVTGSPSEVGVPVTTSERHTMLGGVLASRRLPCSCGRVLLWQWIDQNNPRLMDHLRDDLDRGDGEDDGGVPATDGEPEPAWTEAQRARRREGRGVSWLKRTGPPSRQHRSAEYEKRKARRRRQRAEESARAPASTAKSRPAP